ncbi:hypothetical protein C1H46_014011 [Malus baccata]|uniref:Uncharacterized protein n=1 Tax=Malus baccata TaxID=106549 RepID=A0A540MNN6_MALBA|nr:hypothetical protein C1H46_014011 [Malus baccata]
MINLQDVKFKIITHISIRPTNRYNYLDTDELKLAATISRPIDITRADKMY